MALIEDMQFEIYNAITTQFVLNTEYKKLTMIQSLLSCTYGARFVVYSIHQRRLNKKNTKKIIVFVHYFV